MHRAVNPDTTRARLSPEWRALLYFVCPSPDIDFRLPGYTPSSYCQQTLKKGWAAKRPIPARPFALLPEHAIFRTCSALDPKSLAKLREVSIWFLHYVETEFWHTLETSLQSLANDTSYDDYDCYDGYESHDDYDARYEV